MTTTTDTSKQTAQVYQLFIRATPEQVWEAITKPEFIRRYFHGAETSLELAPGGRYVSHSPDGETLWVDSTVREVDPPRRLVHGWRSLYDEQAAEEPESRVTWEIEPREGGLTLLTVVHDQLERSPRTAGSVGGSGWMLVLSGLKTLLETGEPLQGR
jgi:uncharacterized protein YndB with AHSA1/START domain